MSGAGSFALTNLTKYEMLALDGELNVSDGHPRQSLSPAQHRILQRMPEIFAWAAEQQFADVERRAQRTFLDSLGQLTAPVEVGRVHSSYASSVAMDVVARSLRPRIRTIGLIHPTFDNIPDLLLGWGHQLVPLEEKALTEGEIPELHRLDAVFLTVPNNPTGTVIGPEALRQIAVTCAGRGIPLILDTCFRGFVPDDRPDMYELLDETGVEWIMIEDTGKLWPLLELKLGFISHSRQCSFDIVENLSDVLLSVSPFVLSLVTEFARDAHEGGYEQIHSLIRRNRTVLGEALEDTGASVASPSSGVSVSLVELPDHLSSRPVWRELRHAGLHTLPCDPFFWADRPQGERYIRVALSRDTPLIEKAAALLRDYLLSQRPSSMTRTA
ncbi:aminotransferase class I/II-fold pyridoxal phosphate-dependent enzyme [Streptomyces pseudovenezuelae]|uniref:aminotransferase class I/II-fold pyridoxal phosphate-dependent enzyme n=1 Tax=Streptomyces pseudovenezuelae TaxID=67350 RepID=UPI0036EA8AC6